ncbi:MAG: dihydrofolate reductase [Candidatus Saccharimonadales bacterium]
MSREHGNRNIIVAYDKNRVIGHEGDMPWRGNLPADLRRFKELTTGHTVIMGRTTYDSIGRPLPNRHNIVISRQTNLEIPGCDVVNSLEEAYGLGAEDDELFIIGGAKIYHLAMPTANRLLVTEIDEAFEGDTFFPEIPQEWHEVGRSSRYSIDENNKFCYTFIEYERDS